MGRDFTLFNALFLILFILYILIPMIGPVRWAPGSWRFFSWAIVFAFARALSLKGSQRATADIIKYCIIPHQVAADDGYVCDSFDICRDAKFCVSTMKIQTTISNIILTVPSQHHRL
jgi:hypothetical protein